MCVFLFIDDACFMTQRLVFVFCGCKINKKVRKKLLFFYFLFFKPKSVVRACLYFGFLEEWILFGF